MLTCVRWYVAYPLSLRHLDEMMAERGISVDIRRFIAGHSRYCQSSMLPSGRESDLWLDAGTWTKLT
jgi:hypothetical protein